jgi:molybdopterin converting factor small subunit
LAQSSSSTSVGVRVVYFGMPSSVTGTKKETVELAYPAYLSDLKTALTALHPSLGKMFPSMLVLVDGVSATGNPRLENNVEVDILALGAGG